MNGSSFVSIGTFSLRISTTRASKRLSASSAKRIGLNPAILREHDLAAGDLIRVTNASRDGDHQQKVFALVGDCFASNGQLQFIVGVAWPSSELPTQYAAISSSLLSSLPNLQTGTPLSVQRIDPACISPAAVVSLEYASTSGKCSSIDEDMHGIWLKAAIREALVDMRYIWANRMVDVGREGGKYSFRVVGARRGKGEVEMVSHSMERLSIQIQPTSREELIWVADWHLEVEFVQPGNQNTTLHSLDGGNNAYASVGGLSRQIALIRDLVEIPMTRPDLFAHFNLRPPRGLLLHGPPGTGKTHLAHAIAASINSNVIVVNGPELSSAYHGETEKRLREVFERAERSSPCIVVLDEVDAICPKRDDGNEGGEVAKRVVATLLTIMDGMEDVESARHSGREKGQRRVVVVATTNRPNAIDPALRRPGRFDRELEIGIPDAAARLDILHVMLRETPHDLTADQLHTIAAQTHGYVGADLSGLVREAGILAIKQQLSATTSTSLSNVPTGVITYANFLHALPSTRPSALRSLVIETPKVYWSDIGGVSNIRERLKEAIEWPLLYPETFTRLGISPTKGILLYGPPGCSKTLTAKALATESRINFLAVKGPELLNKYVGESERAIRDVFSKARAAAPCIIFFDEIDAVGIARGGEGSTGAHEGVLTSMLNEMDGVQDLHGVVVVGATNRPDVMDSALMRPGRLDRILYVGPPDAAGREEIIRIQTRKMTTEPGIDFAYLATLTEGCSGAELAAVCQEAAMNAMREDLSAPFVSNAHFIRAAQTARRGISPEMIAKFQQWRETSGLTEV